MVVVNYVFVCKTNFREQKSSKQTVKRRRMQFLIEFSLWKEIVWTERFVQVRRQIRIRRESLHNKLGSKGDRRSISSNSVALPDSEGDSVKTAAISKQFRAMNMWQNPWSINLQNGCHEAVEANPVVVGEDPLEFCSPDGARMGSRWSQSEALLCSWPSHVMLKEIWGFFVGGRW